MTRLIKVTRTAAANSAAKVSPISPLLIQSCPSGDTRKHNGTQKLCTGAAVVSGRGIETSGESTAEIHPHINGFNASVFAADNAGDASSTGSAKTSKIASKIQRLTQVVDITTLVDRKKDFGVAFENIFFLGNQGFPTAVNTHYAGAFWTFERLISDAGGGVTVSHHRALRQSEGAPNPNEI